MSTTAYKQYVHLRLGKMFGLVHNGLAVVGLGALVILLMQGTRSASPDDASGRATAFGTIRYEGISLFEPADAENPRYRVIANYLSRKYKIASDATEQLVSGAYEAGKQVGVDPLLILAVMAIESRFNPIAESVMGAKGLMQVIPSYHQDKLVEHGGTEAVLDPMTNILVGARILKEYIRRAGSLEAGLQLYSGSFSDTTGQYAQKVIAEKARLLETIQRFDRHFQKDRSV